MSSNSLESFWKPSLVFISKQLELNDKIMIILIMEGIVHLATYLYSIC